MFIAFTGGALAMWGLTTFGHEPIAFILLFGAIYFTWGEIYSLFPRPAPMLSGRNMPRPTPVFCTRPRERRDLRGPLAAYLVQASGSWSSVFWLSRSWIWPRRDGAHSAAPMRASHSANVAGSAQAAPAE
jgi:OFA family oxalate/formate antiporter-like MFS transporter